MSELSGPNSVSTEGLIAARPHVVNELLFKLVQINTGIEDKLKSYEEKIKQYEDRIKELEEPFVPGLAPVRVSPTYRPLSIRDEDKFTLGKWDLIEEKIGILLTLICIGVLGLLGVTWLDISKSDVTDKNTGWILRYLEDHGEATIYINQMVLSTCLLFDLTSLMIWILREFKVFTYEDFRELHSATSILTVVLLAVHFLSFQWSSGWLLLINAPLYCMVTGGALLVHVFSLFGAKVNTIHCFRGDYSGIMLKNCMLNIMNIMLNVMNIMLNIMLNNVLLTSKYLSLGHPSRMLLNVSSSMLTQHSRESLCRFLHFAISARLLEVRPSPDSRGNRGLVVILIAVIM